MAAKDDSKTTSKSKKKTVNIKSKYGSALANLKSSKNLTPDGQIEVERYRRKKLVVEYADEIEAMREGSLELPSFLKAIAPKLTIRILEVLEGTTDEKLRTRLAQDLLDRAGYAKIQKGAILHQGNIDVNTTKLELVNMVMSLGKKAGIGIESETYDIEGDSDIIDVDSETPDE